MRWPLRYQIFLRFTALLLGTVAIVSVLDAYFAARAHRAQVQQQLRDIATTLSPAPFPLTDSVLRQTHSLSGAHFVVATRSGRIIASSDASLTSVPQDVEPQRSDELVLGDAIELNKSRYLHATVNVQPPYQRSGEQNLHIFYPEQTWRQAWWQNVYPRLMIGGVALLLAALLSAMLAARVSRPITRLRRQVEQIATGDYQELPEPRRNDEFLDLVRDVNLMALMLAQHEEQLRRDERLKALGQLRGGLAHQLRNAVTGCRMALDLHRLRESGDQPPAESLIVAHRQLVLIEKHLDRFLRFAADEAEPALELVDLEAVAEAVVPLVAPAIEHARAQLELLRGEAPVWVRVEPGAIEQVLINLLLNATEAVASRAGVGSGVVKLATSLRPDRVQLIVSDNGPGPSDAVRETLFDPLVTDKPEGTGLGLAASRETVHRYGGDLHWQRENGWTHFVMELPTVDVTSIDDPASGPPTMPCDDENRHVAGLTQA